MLGFLGFRSVGKENMVTGGSLQALEGHSDEVASVSFSPDGKLVSRIRQ